ncbi:MAG: tetratricopeptide repeat protein [Bacteroidales bacterium]|nr:tetratricopeptide repeat protein [Bacteroidales bacterium]
MKYWKMAGLAATILLVLTFPVYLLRVAGSMANAEKVEAVYFTGRESCGECHKKEFDLWAGSHHDMAMDSATENSVLGNFNNFEFVCRGHTHRLYKKNGMFFVNTQGPDGNFSDFQVAYTFGYTPLQQYLVPFPGGRLQCLPLAWDSENNRWFHLADTMYGCNTVKPGDWLYWTGQAQNWNSMCADCHSTNIKKNFIPESNSYQTSWSEIDVSCEACHGPASAHIEWAALPEDARPGHVNAGLLVKTKELNNREQLNICVRCHSRRSVSGDFDHRHPELLEYMVPQLAIPPEYHIDGQINDEVFVYGSFVQSKMFENDVKCSDCHDVHSLKTKDNSNGLCLQCHRPDIYNSPEHHFHQLPDDGGQVFLSNRLKPDYVKGSGSQCVNCHMAGKYYMGNDYRRDHSFRVPRPDLSVRLGTPNACNDCHTDKSAAWAQTYIQKWYGIKIRGHYGETFAMARKGDPGALPLLTLYAENELFPLMIRATAVHLLAGYSDSAAVAAIEKALDDPEALVRHSAVMGYRTSNALLYEKKMLPLLNDPVKAIRAEAAIRLSQVPGQVLGKASAKALKAALEEYKNNNLYMADFPGGQFNLGILYDNTGKPGLAENAYRQSLRIDPGFAQAKVNLAMLYNRQKKNNEAEKLLLEVLAENPAMVEINYSLALLYAEMEKYDKSRYCFIKTIEAEPLNSRALYNLGLLENSLGNTETAEKHLQNALKTEPQNFDFLYAMCTFYVQHKHKEKALHYSEKLKQLFPENPAGSQLLQAARKL